MLHETLTAPIDFAAAWRALLERNDSRRLDADADRAFWMTHAPHYDARTALPGSYSATLAALQRLIRRDDTLLDVGAGTGRFAIPLAPLVSHVTALDHAPAMLDILRAKAQAREITNITCVDAAWETADVMTHDVVLAAWSLYRQLDLCAALEKLAQATRRTLVILASDAYEPPHRPLYESLWGRMNEPDAPAYLYILGALRQIGVRADLHMLYETRRYDGATPAAIARQLAPVQATAESIERFTAGLLPFLCHEAGGWRYTHIFPVGMVVADMR